MLIDVARAFVINSKLNNSLYIHKNINAIHHKLSRVKNIPSDIKKTKRVSIFCPFYITKNSNMLWIESWKSNVLKYVNEYDVYEGPEEDEMISADQNITE